MDSFERHVQLEACFNFRDLGGYETDDGRRVRWGCVFRSDALQRLPPADVERVLDLGVRTVIDLRSTAEQARQRSFAAADAVTFRHLPVFEEGAEPFTPAVHDTPEPPPGEEYVAMATAGVDAFGAALRAVAQHDHAVVFHCAAGKDRTGILAALLLSALGVPDDVIVADYALSERSIEAASAWARANDPDWARWLSTAPPWLLTCPQPAMQAFLDQLRAKHGSIETYLAQAGVDEQAVDALRGRLLE